MTSEVLCHIGHLLYAIAKADKTLSYEEYVKMSHSLDKHWSFLGKSGISQIKAQFNSLQKSNASATKCFEDFMGYYGQNEEKFNEDLKRLILKTANEIAYAFSKINKSELHFMARLSLAFKNTSNN